MSPLPRIVRAAVTALLSLLVAVALAGCAGHSRGVPIENRPTPSQPATPDAVAPAPDARPGQPVEPSGSDQRKSLRDRVLADTTVVRQVVSRCARTGLLPEQDASVDALRDLLRRARIALVSQDLARAGSLARQARQLASSLDCGD